MSGGFANAAMLLGLLGAAIPVLIHLLTRRRAPTIDWGAMQFLDLGRRARMRTRLAELLLMAGRMLLLALVALAAARPFLLPPEADADADEVATGGGAGVRRDVVLVLDGSGSMARRGGDTTPWDLAKAEAGRLIDGLEAGDSVAVLVAKDRVRPAIDPPTFDLEAAEQALDDLPAPRGSSDLPTALARAFEVLERSRNPSRDIVILSDGRRSAWDPGDAGRWRLLRDLHGRIPVEPRILAINLAVEPDADAADGAVGPLELPRSIVAPGVPIELETTVTNAGPGTLTHAAELVIDGEPVAGTAQAVGPVPSGGRVPLTFRLSLDEPGSHAIAVRLVPGGDDPLPANDESARAVEVVEALPVLLVDGEPSLEPLGGEVDFLRAALAPEGDDTPQIRAAVVDGNAFSDEDLSAYRVVVLANVDRLDPGRSSAVAGFVGDGGGLLFAAGDRTDPSSYNASAFRDGDGWLPASIGPWTGDPTRREAVAHPAPATFSGPALSPFAEGDPPPLSEADLFAYRLLEPAARAPEAAVAARLDTGDPWVVERPYRRGRVIMLAGPVDAEAGTLPANPDYVPLMHELILRLADPAPDASPTRPGEPIRFRLAAPPPDDVDRLPVLAPSGELLEALVDRSDDGATAVLESAAEPGLYRLSLPDPPGGFAYASVLGDDREADASPLDPAEAARLADGWPLAFVDDPDRLAVTLLAEGSSGPRPFWRWLVVAALGGLCLEVWFTRQMAISRGSADIGPEQ